LPAGGVELPDWWSDLDDDRPFIHVTQGTLDNGDLSQLLMPTLEALADEPVLVVAATGGKPLADLPGAIPANARVAPMLPYHALMPRTDVMVTNGGYGGVQFALTYGVPMVVAGTTEDKPEVAARVAWSGAGINLRSRRPKPARIRRAVQHVLTNPSYREASRRLQVEADDSDAMQSILGLLEFPVI
jgi:UDP:flavonoid glycosyltransferase YjiC (YdhE family)